MHEVRALFDEAAIERETENICRWGAARAGVIAVAPLLGTLALIANEVYMIGRIAKLRGVELEESAAIGLLTSLGATFTGQTAMTLLPYAPLQIPLGISLTYAVGRVAAAWVKAGQPEDVAAFQEIFTNARKQGLDEAETIEKLDCKNNPLGDESRKFSLDRAAAERIFTQLTSQVDALEVNLKKTWKYLTK